MSLLKLRPYQLEAIDALDKAFTDDPSPAAIQLATGLGKTVIMAEMIRRDLDADRKPLVLVHRDELVHQTVAKIKALCDGATVGVVKAERDEWHWPDAVVASVQSISRRLDRIPREEFTATYVDECHHAAARTYRETIAHFEAGRTAGVTATLSRSDNKALGEVWRRVVMTRDILFGILHGYLTDVRGRRVIVEDLDLSAVKRSGGDYQDGALGEAMEHAEAGKVIANAYREHATLPDGSLRKGIAFWPTVETAARFADDFTAAGIPTEVIVGDTPTEERQAIYRRVRTGETVLLSSCMVLTEGFDMPEISCVVMGRPTSHAGLYVQMAGRGLRPHPGKRDCLLLDVSGASARNSLIAIADLSGRDDVEVRDDETLSEAIERADTPSDARILTGKTSVLDVDLFGTSTSAWLTTPAGTWFIPTRHGVFFLRQDPAGDELWMVGKTATQYNRTGHTVNRRPVNDPRPVGVNQWGWIRSGLPLPYAMAVAEQWANELDPTIAGRSASWRKRSARPTDAQIGLAVRLGIDVTGMNKQAVSDAVSTVYAARMLDPK